MSKASYPVVRRDMIGAGAAARNAAEVEVLGSRLAVSSLAAVLPGRHFAGWWMDSHHAVALGHQPLDLAWAEEEETLTWAGKDMLWVEQESRTLLLLALPRSDRGRIAPDRKCLGAGRTR